MTVGSNKRILSILNVVAVLALASTGYAYVAHVGHLGDAPERPSFQPEAITGLGSLNVKIDSIGITLGQWIDAVETVEVTKAPEQPKVALASLIAKLGEISGAAVVYKPYPPYPCILFKYHSAPEGGDPLQSIGLGEALETRPHRDPKLAARGFTEPSKYRFVGCQPDPERPGWTWFVFDLDCDGVRFDRVHWKAEGDRMPLRIVKPREDPATRRILYSTKNGNIRIYELGQDGLPISVGGPLPDIDGIDFSKTSGGGGAGAEPVVGGADATGEGETGEGTAGQRETEAGEGESIAVEARPPVRVTPATQLPVGVVRTDEGRRVTVFETSGDVFRPTSEGFEYLRKNRERLIKSVDAAPYRDRKTGKIKGLVIRRIKSGSGASAFGFYEDDVITHINDRPVTSREQAIRLVKNEINQRKARFITVRFLRDGQNLTKRFDARDPKLRDAARRGR